MMSADNNNLSSYSNLPSVVPFLTAVDGARYDAKVNRNEVELTMSTHHCETECESRSCSMKDLLSEIGLEMGDVASKKCESDISWPTFINSSVARPKTLIPIVSTERVHAATPPQNPKEFQKICDSIDSTGVYLYSTFTNNEIEEAEENKRDIAFECRQFPRNSYPEDPATGIAAGALVASFHKREIMCTKKEGDDTIYNVSQGKAMGRPSKIRVKIGDYASKETDPSLIVSYTGLVVFDSLTYSDLEVTAVV